MSRPATGKYAITLCGRDATRNGSEKSQASPFFDRNQVMKVRESELIEKISTALGGRRNVSREVRLGIGDDAAVFRPTAGRETLLTCDWFLEGIHFLREKHPASSVG